MLANEIQDFLKSKLESHYDVTLDRDNSLTVQGLESSPGVRDKVDVYIYSGKEDSGNKVSVSSTTVWLNREWEFEVPSMQEVYSQLYPLILQCLDGNRRVF